MGSTTLASGESTNLDLSIRMNEGMGGMHLVEVTIPSNDPEATETKVQAQVNYIE